MADVLITDIENEAKAIYEAAGRIWTNDIYPLLQTVAKDVMPVLIEAAEAAIPTIQGGSIIAGIEGVAKAIYAAAESKGLTIVEADVVSAIATVTTKIASANAAASQAS